MGRRSDLPLVNENDGNNNEFGRGSILGDVDIQGQLNCLELFNRVQNAVDDPTELQLTGRKLLRLCCILTFRYNRPDFFRYEST